MKRMLQWLITGTRGGRTRAKAIQALKERPQNANQLAEVLNLDYKTIKHHIKVLQDNKIITGFGGSYGKLYFISKDMEANYQTFEDMLKKMGG